MDIYRYNYKKMDIIRYQLSLMDASLYHYFIIDADKADKADDRCIYISLYLYFNGWMHQLSIISSIYQHLSSLMNDAEWADDGWMHLSISKGHQQDNPHNINRLQSSMEPTEYQKVRETAGFFKFSSQKNDRKMLEKFENNVTFSRILVIIKYK